MRQIEVAQKWEQIVWNWTSTTDEEEEKGKMKQKMWRETRWLQNKSHDRAKWMEIKMHRNGEGCDGDVKKKDT